MSKRLGAGLVVSEDGVLSFGGIKEDSDRLRDSYAVVDKPIGWWDIGEFYL